MARKPDQAHLATDKEIEKIEKEISKEYRKAHKEMKQKLDDYLSQFARKDKQWQEWVKDGKVTQNDYIDWRKGQILIGKRWEDMVDVLATDLSNTAQIAQSIAKGHAPEVYAINHNYATFDVEKGSGLDTSYTLYSRETVERMYRENPKLYHKYGKAVEKEIKEGKQKAWDKKRIRSVLTQAVLQGESIPKITKRLEIVTGGDHNAAIRNARTMMTGVQNAGRIDAMNRAQDKGIPVRKQWLATIDGRTRHWHRELDGAVEDLDKPFENSIGKIMFPADPDADGANVYNCRCTLLSAIKGFELDVTDPSIRPMPKLKDMTYEEWKTAKAPKSISGGGITEFLKSDRSMDFGKVFGENGVSYLGKDDASREIESALVQLQERYPMNQANPLEFRATVDSIIVDDYKNAWVHLPKGIDDTRLDGWAIAQVFQNDINGKNRAVLAFNRDMLFKNSTIDEVVLARTETISKDGIIIDLSGQNPTAVAIHEWGHVYTEHMTSAMIYDDPDAKEYWEWYKSLSKEDIKKGISSYATENRGEFEAECFLEMQMPNPRPLAVKWWSYMKKVVAKGF